MTATKRTTEQEIVRILKALKSAGTSDKERRTRLVRDLAAVTLDLREHYLTGEGQPDWKGSTGTYRLAMRDLYSDAGYDSDEAVPLQNTVRYHVANRMREVLSPEQLQDLGLNVTAPRERFVERRKHQSALLSVLEAMNEEDLEGSEQDKVAVLANITYTLTKLKPNKRALRTAANLDTADTGHQALRAMQARIEQLLEAYPAKP